MLSVSLAEGDLLRVLEELMLRELLAELVVLDVVVDLADLALHLEVVADDHLIGLLLVELVLVMDPF